MSIFNLPKPTSAPDPRDLPSPLTESGYIPELNYAERQWKPFGERIPATDTLTNDRMKGPPGHFCDRCQLYYKNIADKGLVKSAEFSSGWPIICTGDKSARMEQFTPDVLEEMVRDGVLEDSEEARDQFLISLDPVRWAEYEFGIQPDWYQAEMLRCSSRWKSARAGRRVGKTYTTCLDIWYSAYTKDGKDVDRFEILIVCPYEAQVKKIFDELMTLLNRSKNLKRSFKRYAKSPWEIELHNGTIIRGFSAGRKTGARSDKIRGQGAQKIYFDEIDYMADQDIETILASMADQKDTEVWMSSTPTGARTKFWLMCTDKNQRYKEFHFISAESPRWSADVERMLKSIYSQGGYEREFFAEFGSPTEGVFRQQNLDKCVKNYSYDDLKRQPGCRYILGVDWNKTTGTHLVVLEMGNTEKRGVFYRVVDKLVIRKAEFLQHEAILKIMEVGEKWKVDHIYVDQGYGEVQVENLLRQDRDHPEFGLRYRERLHMVHGNQTIEIRDPRNPGEFIRKPAKPFMVDLLSAWVAAGALILPASEDTHSQLIESEIPYLDIGIVQQMREFRVEKYSPTGQPRYSQGYEHTLMALGFAALGMALNFTEINQTKIDSTVRYHDVPLGSAPKPALPAGPREEGEKPARKEQSAFEQTAAARTIPGMTKSSKNTILSTMAQMQGIVTGQKTTGVPTRKRMGYTPRLPAPRRTIP